MNMEQASLGPIGQIARTVRDIAVAREWYGTILGLKHLYSFGGLAFFYCGGTRLFLSQSDETVHSDCLYFKVDDINAWHHRLSARGIIFVDEPHLIHRHDNGVEEWMTFFTDPEAKLLALMSEITP